MLIALGAVVAAVLLWLPFAVTRRRGGAPCAGRLALFVYFASLGLGFMLIEISMIQRFALLLGFPTLSLSVSLFTLLSPPPSAPGARASCAAGRGGLPAVTAALIVITGAYLLIAEPLTDVALAWPQWARIAVVFVLLFPVGLLLGVFLPTGMDAVVAAADGAGRRPGPARGVVLGGQRVLLRARRLADHPGLDGVRVRPRRPRRPGPVRRGDRRARPRRRRRRREPAVRRVDGVTSDAADATESPASPR